MIILKKNILKKAKFCYIHTDSLIRHVKTEKFYKDIKNDVEKKSDTSNYKVEKSLPKQNKN